jgi:DNA modification methylase
MNSTEAVTSIDRLRLEMWPVARLTPSARNARTHSKAQIAEIAASIKGFGFSNPILVGVDGDIIAGHGRLAAARQLALTEVPVVVISGLTDVQRRQLMLADNRIGLSAAWDLEMLAAELTDLSVLGADLAILGFTKQELAKALTPAGVGGLTDEDEVPDLPEKRVTAIGDVWLAGPHRICCGDSTDAAAVTALLGDLEPGLMVTDPPYGVSYDPEWRHRIGVNRSVRTGKVLNDDKADWGAAWGLFPGNVAYVWHGALHSTTVADSLVTNGFTIRAQIVWAKERLILSRGDYHWQHEPCWYAVRDKGNWTGDRKQTTLWSIPSGGQDTKTTHGTQKPVDCMRRPMLNNSSPGQSIYDPFLGSGTTLIAAETTGRVCLAMELEPRYVDVAVRRWQAFTGMTACLLIDGRSFEAIAAERLPEVQSTNTNPAPDEPAENQSRMTSGSIG